MRKYWVWIAVFVVIVAGASAYYYFFMGKEAYKGIPAANAVPHNSPVVFIVDDAEKLTESIVNTDFWDEISHIGAFSTLKQGIGFFETDILEHADIEKLLSGRKVVVSMNFSGKNSFDYLFLVTLDNRAQFRAIDAYIASVSKDKKWKTNRRNYSACEVTDILSEEGKSIFSYAVSNGILLISASPVLVESGIRQLEIETLFENGAFKRLYDISGDNSHLSVFLNHKTFPQLLAFYLSNANGKKIGEYTDYAEWSGLDVDFQRGKVLLNGFSLWGDSIDNYLKLFDNQEIVRGSIESVLPASTSMMLSLSFSDFGQFMDDYDDYLHGSAKYFRRVDEFNRISKRFGIDVANFFRETVEHEIALAYTGINGENFEKNSLWAVQVKSRSQAREALLQLLTKVGKKEQRTVDFYISKYKIDNELSYDIYKFPAEKAAYYLLGDMFAPVRSNYVAFVDNYMLFSGSKKSLSEALYANVLNQTLGRDVGYVQFCEELTSRYNFSFYLNFSKGIKLAPEYLREDLATLVDKNQESFLKFKALAWRFGHEKDMVFNYAVLNFDSEIKEEPLTVWKSRLDTVAQFKPVFMKNHRDTRNKEVMVQDMGNTLYLINKEGRTLWKVKLDGQVMGEISQIDYYKNGKLQYLMNTPTKIYLIDRNGNRVDNYPVKLPSPATNPIGVVDYDKNRDYRIFVACENKKVYAYQKDGKLVSGWNFGTTERIVTTPVNHYRMGQKDYIVFADQRKTYILDRKGNTRVKTPAIFEHSPNNTLILEKRSPLSKSRLVTTDTEGKVQMQYFDGTHETIDLGTFSVEHYFEYEDLNGDGRYEYILADDDELLCYNYKKKKVFGKSIEGKIDVKPNIYTFSARNKKVGVVSNKTDKIYLFNNTGRLYDGFPLRGNSGFSIGFLSKGSTNFNLVVTDDEGHLLNYKIE